MESTATYELDLLTLVAEFLVARQGHFIDNDTFWDSLECVNFARKNPGDEIVRRAMGVFSDLLRLAEPLPGAGQAFDSVVELVMGKKRESEAAVARSSCGVDAALRDTAANVASTSGDTQTNSASSNASISMPHIGPPQDLPLLIKRLIRKLLDTYVFCSSRLKLRRSRRSSPRRNQRKATDATHHSVDTISATRPPIIETACSAAKAEPVAEQSLEESLVLASVTETLCLLPPTKSPVVQTIPPSPAPVPKTKTPTPERALATESLVPGKTAQSPSTRECGKHAIAGIRPPFDTDFTQDDLDKIRVYDGKVDFGTGAKHRIQRAWDYYKSLTKHTMEAMAEILEEPCEKADLGLLDRFQTRLGSDACERLGEPVLPSTFACELKDSIVWRKAACAWYANLQVAMEAQKIPHDRGYEELRDKTSKYEHFMIQLLLTFLAFEIYEDRTVPDKEGRIKLDKSDYNALFGTKEAVVTKNSTPKGANITDQDTPTSAVVVDEAQLHVETGNAELEDMDMYSEDEDSEDGLLNGRGRVFCYHEYSDVEDQYDDELEDGLEDELDY